MTDTGPPTPSPAGTLERLRLAWASYRSSLSPGAVTALVIGGLALVVAAFVGLRFLRPAGGAPPDLVLPRAVPSASDPAAPAVTTTSVTSTLATVHAAGAVARPGVYVVPATGRVADVIAAAGGPVPEADIDRMNLAARVADGQRVYVPRRGEEQPPAPVEDPVAQPPSPPAPSGPVDLNAADEKALEALPGVGAATAKAIVAYRTEHGRFRSVDELIDVPGIGPRKLETLRPLVKV